MCDKDSSSIMPSNQDPVKEGVQSTSTVTSGAYYQTVINNDTWATSLLLTENRHMGCQDGLVSKDT